LTVDETWAVGLDVGGTKIAAGLIRFPAGVVVHRRRIPTRAERGPRAVLADAVESARELAALVPSGGRFVGVGLGVPELVDPNGRVASGHTIDWRGLSLTEPFAAVGPVWVEADVRIAALAEARFGAGRPFRIIAYVTIGTGISSTLVVDGRPYAGARGNALILASSPTSVVCPACHSWARPVLEEFSSGPALVKRYNQGRSEPVENAEAVVAGAARGEPDAVRVIRDAGEALGSGLGFLINVLDPDAVVVGGGLGLAGGLYWEALVDSARRHTWSETTRELPILPAQLGPDAGLIGAALTVRDREQETARPPNQAMASSARR
jgi:glucokinase